MAAEKLKRELGFRDVVLFYIVSGLSLRWIATAAASGQSAIVVWLLAWCGFFLPLAGCVLELSSRYPQEGGLYVWTREAYGEFAAFMAGWTYWMSNLPYFAAVLYFAASSLLFAIPRGEHLADTNIYFLLFTVSMLALITVLNVLGLNLGKWLNNLGAVGMALPILILIGLGWLSFSRFGSATQFTMAGIVPHAHVKDLVFWSTIFFAFGGVETVSFMGEEVKNPRRVIPRSLLVAGVIITLGYLAGTVAMLAALPSSSISGLGGFMTAIDFLCHRLGLGPVVAPIAILVAISSVGAAAAYLTATARLPFVAGIDHYLPPVFGRIHPRWKTPYVAVISYGLAGMLFGLLSQAGNQRQRRLRHVGQHGCHRLLHPLSLPLCLNDPPARTAVSTRCDPLAMGKTTGHPASLPGILLHHGRDCPRFISGGRRAQPIRCAVQDSRHDMRALASGGGHLPPRPPLDRASSTSPLDKAHLSASGCQNQQARGILSRGTYQWAFTAIRCFPTGGRGFPIAPCSTRRKWSILPGGLFLGDSRSME